MSERPLSWQFSGKTVFLSKKMPKQFLNRHAFTMVEVLTVVAVISLISVFVIPNLLRIKANANEMAAKETLKSISAAMSSYRDVNPTFPSQLIELGSTAVGGEELPYLDDTTAQGATNGYSFQITSSNADTFTLRATPTASLVLLFQTTPLLVVTIPFWY